MEKKKKGKGNGRLCACCFFSVFSHPSLSPPSITAPSPVVTIKKDRTSRNSISLSWQEPEHPNGIILDYEVKYYEKVGEKVLQGWIGQRKFLLSHEIQTLIQIMMLLMSGGVLFITWLCDLSNLWKEGIYKSSFQFLFFLHKILILKMLLPNVSQIVKKIKRASKSVLFKTSAMLALSQLFLRQLMNIIIKNIK